MKRRKIQQPNYNRRDNDFVGNLTMFLSMFMLLGVIISMAITHTSDDPPSGRKAKAPTTRFPESYFEAKEAQVSLPDTNNNLSINF